MKKKLILASASPRRKEILEQMGLTFAICPASGEERLNTEDPEEAVKALALQRQRRPREDRRLRLWSSDRIRWWPSREGSWASLRMKRKPSGCCACCRAGRIWCTPAWR